MKKIGVSILMSFVCFISCKKNSDVIPPNTEENEFAQTIVIPICDRDSVTTLSQSLIAFNKDGTLKWQRKKLGTYNYNHTYYHDGILFYSTFHISYAIDINTGSNIWTTQDELRSVQIRNDSMFCCSDIYNYIWCYNAKTGNVLWYATTSDPTDNLKLDENTLYFITYSANTVANINAMDIKTKVIKWKAPIGINIRKAPSHFVIDGDKLYIKNGTGKLLCFNKNSGTQLWSYGDNDVQVQQPVYGNNTIFTAIDPDSFPLTQGITAFNSATGGILWQWNAPYYFPGGNPYFQNNRLYVMGEDNSIKFISCLNSNDGTEIWRHNTSFFYEDPTVVGNELFAFKDNLVLNSNSHTSHIMIFDSNTGNAKDSIPVSATNSFGKISIITSLDNLVESN